MVSEIVTKKFIIKTHTFCLSENPLLAPGNVSAVEGIIFEFDVLLTQEVESGDG